jgi:hypothetical protein
MVVVQHGAAALSQPFNDRVVRLRRQAHRVVHVNSTTASAQTDLGPPQTYARPVRGHHPDCLVGPALHHF